MCGVYICIFWSNIKLKGTKKREKPVQRNDQNSKLLHPKEKKKDRKRCKTGLNMHGRIHGLWGKGGHGWGNESKFY